MDPQEEQQRGVEAAQLLRNPLLIEAMAAIEARIVDRLAAVDIKPEEVLRVQALLAAKRAFERYLTQVTVTGKMSDIAEQERRSILERVKRTVRS